MVESIQGLAVASFILIMVRAGSWNPATTLGVLLAATAFATMTKATTPLFCIWPGLVALATTIHRSRTGATWRWRDACAWLSIGVCLIIGAGAWYYRNWAAVVSHLRGATTGRSLRCGKGRHVSQQVVVLVSSALHGFLLIPSLAPSLDVGEHVARIASSTRVRLFPIRSGSDVQAGQAHRLQQAVLIFVEGFDIGVTEIGEQFEMDVSVLFRSKPRSRSLALTKLGTDRSRKIPFRRS
jgi:hypothetical protein